MSEAYHLAKLEDTHNSKRRQGRVEQNKGGKVSQESRTRRRVEIKVHDGIDIRLRHQSRMPTVNTYPAQQLLLCQIVTYHLGMLRLTPNYATVTVQILIRVLPPRYAVIHPDGTRWV
jgi:hypothetical protein